MAVTGGTNGRSSGSLVISTRIVRAIAGGAACVVLLGVPSAVWAGGDGLRLAPDAIGTASLATAVSPPTLGLGGSFVVTATLTAPTGGPPPTGTIGFSVYGPTDPNCAGPVVFRSTNTVAATPSLSGAFSTSSGGFTPPSVGTYHEIAAYTGDSNYPAVLSSCGDPSAAVTVGLAPALTSISPASAPSGATVALTGTNLTGASTVNFGTASTPATVLSATEVVATVPAGTGTVGLSVTTPFGTTPAIPGDAFNFVVASPGPESPATVGTRPPVADTGITTDITASSAELTGTVDPSGVATSAHFEYTVRLPGGLTRTARTPDRPVVVGVVRTTVTADVTGLVAASRYRVRLVATNSAGTTIGPATSFETTDAAKLPRPVLGRTFVAEPLTGTVYVRLPGKGRSVQPLAAARLLPVGTTLDTRQGVARLTTATATGRVDQLGSFGGGTFTLLQSTAGSGVPDLEFVRASTSAKVCAAAPGHARPQVILASIYATVTGRFEVRGHDGSATGTQATWVTTDRCDGFLTSVSRGTVAVDDFGSGRKTAVRAGKSYLAKAP